MTTVEVSKYSWIGLLRVIGVLLAELLIIHYARHALNFECHTERYGFCGLARNALLASYSLAAVFIILGVFARDAWRDLLSEADIRLWSLTLNVAGLGVLLGSLMFLRSELSVYAQVVIYAVWIISASAAVVGALLMIAPFDRWRAFGAQLRWRLPLVALAGLAAPFIAVQVRPVWNVEFLSDQTFRLVTWLLAAWGQPLEPHEGDKVIGAEGFFINVAPSCSGIEGLVLTTVFALIYLVLFRRELQFPRALLILPVALCASWLLNGLRIAVLVQLGISGYPELAVGGFHSHAGWLMFTLLSLGIVLVTQSTRVFRAGNAEAVSHTAPPPFFADPAVAQILPFVVFMASALVAQTFSNVPGLLYPMRFLAMAASVLIFVPIYLRLPWKIDGVSILCGVVVGFAWLATAEASQEPTDLSVALAGMSSIAFFIWTFCRIAGTIVLVPLIEELFFRGYLTNAIEGSGGRWRVMFALVVTSALFGALHDRWIIAALAGIAFGLVKIRSDRLTDAIVAHAVANAIIAAAAAMRSDWALI